MRLTVLGSSASQPGAGDASSSYLVTGGRRRRDRVLLDCGSGIVGNLLQHTALSELSAIFVSHMHPDHYIDLIAMRYGLRYGDGRSRPLDVYLPPGGRDQLQAVSEAISKTQPFFEGALNIHEYEPEAPLTVGDLTVRPFRVVHGIPSHGMPWTTDGRAWSTRPTPSFVPSSRLPPLVRTCSLPRPPSEVALPTTTTRGRTCLRLRPVRSRCARA